jgi:hypothetical protein
MTPRHHLARDASREFRTNRLRVADEAILAQTYVDAQRRIFLGRRVRVKVNTL